DEDKEPPAATTLAQKARTAQAAPRSPDVTAATPPGAAPPEPGPPAASEPPPTRAAPLRTPEATALSDTDTTATDAAVEESLAAEDDGPAALPGYDRMTLAQVRGHLRDLTADDVSALLSYEQS